MTFRIYQQLPPRNEHGEHVAILKYLTTVSAPTPEAAIIIGRRYTNFPIVEEA